MTLPALSERIGVPDIFVLKKRSDEQFFNTGGAGRGHGWAGNVSLDSTHEPWLSQVIEHGVQRRSSGVPFRAFGPYWTTSVSAISLDEGIVVLGGGDATEVSDEELESVAREAVSAAAEVAPDKLDADEAEVRQAVEALHAAPEGSRAEIAQHVATTTARALSCEFGAVLLYGPPVELHVANEGWVPAATPEEVVAALLPLRAVATEDLYVEQDISQSPFPFRPLSYDDGLVARCVVPLGEGGSRGMLVAAHAGTTPRGFTTLCQRVALTLGNEGTPLLERAD